MSHNRLSTTLLAAAIALFPLSCALHAQSSAGWKPFAPQGGLFSVDLPSECTPQPDVSTDKNGSITRLWKCFRPGAWVYLWGYTEYKSISSVAGELAADRDNFDKSAHLNLLDQHDIVTDGVPGIEFDSSNARLVARVRVWVVGNRAFIAVATEVGTQLTEDAKTFLQSFHFTAPDEKGD